MTDPVWVCDLPEAAQRFVEAAEEALDENIRNPFDARATARAVLVAFGELLEREAAAQRLAGNYTSYARAKADGIEHAMTRAWQIADEIPGEARHAQP